jgi:hypothetical protein
MGRERITPHPCPLPTRRTFRGNVAWGEGGLSAPPASVPRGVPRNVPWL